MGSDSPENWNWWVERLIDVPFGIATTFLGILLVYLVARPRVKFDSAMQVTQGSRTEKSPSRYGVRLKGDGWIPILELKVTVFLQVKGPVRMTSIPVPLSRDTWVNVRRNREPDKWRASPRLLIDQIDWKGHLPSRLSRPKTGTSLQTILKDLNATLFVRVTASSVVFAVSSVSTKTYESDEWAAAPNS
jgi:hypothetical protein